MKRVWSLVLFFSLVSSEHLFAQDSFDYSKLGICQNEGGRFLPISKLVCESTPALLKAMNPGLKLPRCDQPTPPKVLPGHLPVSATFVSCGTPEPPLRPACIDIARKLLQEGKGVTVNILLSEEQLRGSSELLKSLAALTEMSDASHPLNIIPVRGTPALFQRDNQVFRKGTNGKTEVVAASFAGDNLFVLDDMRNACGFPEVRLSYSEMATFDSAYERLVDEVRRGNPAARREVKRLESLRFTELFGRPGEFDSKRKQNLAKGGNFMAMPNGVLLTGSRERLKAPQQVLDSFRKRQPVVEIQLPDLWIGHIDEVFNIVPAEGECGFAVLRASPKKAKEFLRRTPDVVIAEKFVRAKAADSKRLSEIITEGGALNQSIRERRSKNLADEPEAVEKLKILSREFRAMQGSMRSQTAKDILGESELMQRWDEFEKQIQSAQAQLVEEMKKFPGCGEIKFVDVPVLWGTDGSPLLPNPVNGLHVNGGYFYSQPGRDRFREATWNSETLTWKDHFDRETLPELEKEVAEIFEQAGIKTSLHPTDTHEYDSGSGNFHCATNNIYLPCDPSN